MTGAIIRDALWRLEHRTVSIRGEERPMRFVAFERGWLASIDIESGPTIGADRSLYLAAWRALEPLGVDLVDAMIAVADVPR